MAERNPSKQRRAAQNKAQRQALASRKARANEPRPERPAPVEPVEPVDDVEVDDGVDEAAEAAPRRRSRFKPQPAKTDSGRPSRSAPARQPAPTRRATPPASSGAKGGAAKAKPAPAPAAGRLGRTPPEKGPDHPEEPGWRGFLVQVQSVAGGKAVLFALIFSIVAAGTLLLASVVQRTTGTAAAQIANAVNGSVPKDALESSTSTDSVTLLQAVGPIGFAFAALPIVICGFALEGVRRPNRRRTFTIAAFALGIYVVFFSFIGIFYFFSMAALFFAAYQARKADPPVRVPRQRASKRSADEDDEDA